MLVLVPVALVEVLVEVLNAGRLGVVVLPLLLVGVLIGAARRWPWWSLWWLGWTLLALTLAGLFWLPGPTRPPMIFAFWKLFLAGFLIFVGLAIWQRGDSLRVVFILFPWSLELVRFSLFDDSPPEASHPFLLMRLASVVIYAVVALLFVRRRSPRDGWLVLLVGALVYFVVAAVVSLSIFFFYLLLPGYLPLLLLLAFGPLVMGLSLNAYRARGELPILNRIGLLALMGTSLVGLCAPWLTGDSLRVSPYAPVAAQVPGPRQAVIIDTDLSHDDYVAILYLLQRTDVDVRAITLVNGVAFVDAGLENLHRLLGMVGRADIPVAAGPSAPLVGDNAFPDRWRFALELMLRPALPRPGTSPPAVPASQLIGQVAADSPTPVIFVALGPLTNLAQALSDDPSLASRLNSVVVSGGALYVEDPSSPSAAEWNLFVDPHAADSIFRSGVPLVLIPLDVTDPYGPRPILISRDFVNRFAESSRGRESRVMARIMRLWLAVNPGADAVPLWDAPAVAITVEPDICTDWRDLSVRVVVEPPQSAGRTVVDDSAQPNIRVCLGGDQAAFDASYLAVAH